MKVGILILASVATFVHLLAQPLVRFVSADWGWLMPVSVVAAALGGLLLLVWPLWETWRPVPFEGEGYSG